MEYATYGGVIDIMSDVQDRGRMPVAGGSPLKGIEAAEIHDARVLYRWSASISTMLVNFRCHFSGDLDQFVIYLVFAVGELARRTGGGQPRGINALSIADITHIPRETTRRKLRELAAIGHVCCAPDGLWYLGDTDGMDRLTASVGCLLNEARQRGSGSPPIHGRFAPTLNSTS